MCLVESSITLFFGLRDFFGLQCFAVFVETKLDVLQMQYLYDFERREYRSIIGK